MRISHATDMLAPGFAGDRLAAVWADLGCGRGTFTLALARVLKPGSTIHAMDTNAAALAALPSSYKEVRIQASRGDFLEQTWPFADLDGILMANSLHYVRDPASFIRRCAPCLKPDHRFLIVEYDTGTANCWVPYPVNRGELRSLFSAAGYSSFSLLSSRRSIYNRAPLYAALISSVPSPPERGRGSG
jgi:SAM-dependent methyltransferase